jgi:hypothetical protein
MFQGKELERLRLKREQLAFQSDANRARWISDWQRLKSPESWLDEFLGFTGRHPLSITALATTAGLLAIKILRKPGRVLEGIGQWGKLVPLILALWRLFRMKQHRSPTGPETTPHASASNRP